MTSPDFWVLLRTLAGHPESSPVVFDILEGGVSGSPSAIIADNYEAAISLLNDFASAAKVGAVAEQKGTKAGDRRQRGARPPKKDTPSDNAIVSRGVKAIGIIYNMTSRIPHLMKQSHLESSEGECRCNERYIRFFITDNLTSMVRILVAHFPSSHDAMHQPMP